MLLLVRELADVKERMERVVNAHAMQRGDDRGPSERQSRAEVPRHDGEVPGLRGLPYRGRYSRLTKSELIMG